MGFERIGSFCLNVSSVGGTLYPREIFELVGHLSQRQAVQIRISSLYLMPEGDNRLHHWPIMQPLVVRPSLSSINPWSIRWNLWKLDQGQLSSVLIDHKGHPNIFKTRDEMCKDLIEKFPVGLQRSLFLWTEDEISGSLMALQWRTIFSNIFNSVSIEETFHECQRFVELGETFKLSIKPKLNSSTYD